MKMSLEAKAPILLAVGSKYCSSDVDLETTASLHSTLNDQAALSRSALLVTRGKGSKKGGLNEVCLSSFSWPAPVNG